MREDFIRPQSSDDASKATPQKVLKKNTTNTGTRYNLNAPKTNKVNTAFYFILSNRFQSLQYLLENDNAKKWYTMAARQINLVRHIWGSPWQEKGSTLVNFWRYHEETGKKEGGIERKPGKDSKCKNSRIAVVHNNRERNSKSFRKYPV